MYGNITKILIISYIGQQVSFYSIIKVSANNYSESLPERFSALFSMPGALAIFASAFDDNNPRRYVNNIDLKAFVNIFG